MAELVVSLGRMGDHLPVEPWVLVFGGTTREGNRRARRAIRAALQTDTNVLWFDGYSERQDAAAGSRVPLDVAVPEGRVVVVDYAQQERAHWLNQLVDNVPGAVMSTVVKTEERLVTAEPGRVPLPTRLRRAVERIMAVVRRKILNRLSLIFRGRTGWGMVKGDLAYLAKNAPPPVQIIYGDDFAVTLGWHAARVWLDARTSMEFEAP